MKLKFTVNGILYNVEVEVDVPEWDKPQPGYIPPAGRAESSLPTAPPPVNRAAPAFASEAVADESKVCRSPISGVVVRVSAEVGQEIKANEELLALEAMKMETVITSPIDGRIAKINAAPGDPVQGGQVLVEFE